MRPHLKQGTHEMSGDGDPERSPRSMQVDQSVGNVIRGRRIELGIERIDLATASSCSLDDIVAFEEGWRRPSAADLIQLAQSLDVLPTYFFKDLDPRGL